MVKQKDVLRKFIETQLPGLRKTSLKVEVKILEEFVDKRKTNSKRTMYSRDFSDKNISYHLARLGKAKALKSNEVENVKVMVDLAEENQNRRTKRGSEQIKKVRELRVDKLIEHANNDPAVFSVICRVLSVSSIEEAEEQIAYTSDFQEEKEHYEKYNVLVKAIKAEGIEPTEYDELVWRNTAKPWWLNEELIHYLRENGINMEG